MATINVSIIGNGMSTSSERRVETLPEHEVFIVRFRNGDDDIRATRAMARIGGGVAFDGKGNNRVNGVQYGELLRLGIPHKLVNAPPLYKPPSAKALRK